MNQTLAAACLATAPTLVACVGYHVAATAWGPYLALALVAGLTFIFYTVLFAESDT